MPGQRLGPKKKYAYIMDDGTTIRLALDATLGDLSGTGLTELTTGSTAQNKPTNFKPRAVYVQAIDEDGNVARKRVVCNTGGALYSSNSEQNVTIDSEVFQTTGRVGETYSFS